MAITQGRVRVQPASVCFPPPRLPARPRCSYFTDEDFEIVLLM